MPAFSGWRSETRGAPASGESARLGMTTRTPQRRSRVSSAKNTRPPAGSEHVANRRSFHGFESTKRFSCVWPCRSIQPWHVPERPRNSLHPWSETWQGSSSLLGDWRFYPHPTSSWGSRLLCLAQRREKNAYRPDIETSQAACVKTPCDPQYQIRTRVR